jgi:predicted permease
MSLWRQISRGLRALVNRSRSDREIADEVDDYFSRATAAHIARGLSAEEARRASRVEMGSELRVREEVRSFGWENRVETLIADLRYALRSLRSTAGFTIVVVLTLALGIGANTAIFSVIYAALLRPLPYFQPDRLLTLTQTRSATDARFWDASYPDFLDWQKQSKTVQALAGFQRDGAILRGEGDPEPLNGASVTPNFFSTLGVKPALGRDFEAGEDVQTGPNVVILTYSFWQSRLGGVANIIGRPLQLDNHRVTVIGVLPRDFEFAPAGLVQYWAPLHIGMDMATRRNLRWISVLGRLAPGTRESEARSEMELITQRLAAEYPQQNGAIRVVIRSLRERIVGQIQPVLLILFAAVAIVLIIACCNVANLLVARASRRRREFSIRAALGAGWGRLVSQSLVESGVLAAAGSVLGVLLAHWGTTLLILPIPKAQLGSMPFLLDVHTNTVVLAFVCGIAVLVALACGMTGALESFHHSGTGSINEESRASTGSTRTRLRNLLVISEVAFSLVLLVGAGLMGRSLVALLHRQPGFNRSNLLNFNVNLPDNAYPQEADRARFNQQFSASLRSIPGVVDIAATTIVPLTGGGNTIRFVIDSQAVDAGHESECIIRRVSSNYFSMMGIPLVSGRFFDDAIDTPEAPQRLIVSQEWVQRYMPGENPLGRRIRFTFSPTQPFREIIGVVGDIADASLDSATEPSLFVPARQQALSFIPYLVRTSVPPSTLVHPIRTALGGIDSSLVMIAPLTMDEIANQSGSVFLRRYPSYLIGSFAGLALFLAIVGLYGLISYSVAQRTRELGVRIALGARPTNVMQLVLAEGARLILIGMSVGIAASLALTRLMSSLLFGISAADPVTLVGVAVLLAVVAGTACTIPARRAVRTDPIVALREM